jgi:hypothetical protein
MVTELIISNVPLLRFGGLVLTHDELENGDLVPTWTSVDAGSVYTLRESFTRLQDEGWTVIYHRTPISSDRPIEVSARKNPLKVHGLMTSTCS